MNTPPSATLIPQRSSAHPALVAMSLLVASTFALTFSFAVLANFWPGPFVDYWIDIPNVEKFFHGTLTLHDLVSAHANVHRLFIPRLLFIADYRYFAGTNVLLIAVSVLCKMVTLLLFHYLVRDQPARMRWMLNALFFAAIFNAANLSNVLHNSNMQWDLASVFSCLAIVFYCQNLHHPTPQRRVSIALAVLFFVCGFLSQAGALPVLCVFVFISLLNHRWRETAFSFAFMLLVFYLTFFVLPVNEPDKPSYENALVIFIVKLKYVGLYVFKMFSGSLYPLDHNTFIFSWIVLALFITSLALSRKTQQVYDNVFLHLALFAFLMMVIIAAARLDFAPNTWEANRYQTNVLLFLLALSVHTTLAIPVWFRSPHAIRFRHVFLVGSLASFFLTQRYLASYPFVFGNKVFAAQAYMLTHGANQNNGADLLPSLQAFDRIAEPDPFFRAHGFAWYHNKQASTGLHPAFLPAGSLFLSSAEASTLPSTCRMNTSAIHYQPVKAAEGLEFSTPLTPTQGPFLLSLLFRNTDYVLDAHGVVIGFAYLWIDPEHPYTQAEWHGYVTAPSARYLVDVDNKGTAVCHYQLQDAAPL